MRFAEIIPIKDPLVWGQIFGHCRNQQIRACRAVAFYHCTYRTRGSRNRFITQELCHEHATIFAEKFHLPPPPVLVDLPTVDLNKRRMELGMRNRMPQIEETRTIVRVRRKQRGLRLTDPEFMQLFAEAQGQGLDFSSYARHLLHTHPDRKVNARKSR